MRGAMLQRLGAVSERIRSERGWRLALTSSSLAAGGPRRPDCLFAQRRIGMDDWLGRPGGRWTHGVRIIDTLFSALPASFSVGPSFSRTPLVLVHLFYRSVFLSRSMVVCHVYLLRIDVSRVFPPAFERGRVEDLHAPAVRRGPSRKNNSSEDTVADRLRKSTAKNAVDAPACRIRQQSKLDACASAAGRGRRLDQPEGERSDHKR